MPPRSRRPFRAFAHDEVASAAVENALILAVTAGMILAVRAAGVTALVKPSRQAFEALIRALS